MDKIELGSFRQSSKNRVIFLECHMIPSHVGDFQRLAVLLSKFEGMSYAEIATVMELSPQALKSLLSRARENLREVLQPYFDHGIRPTMEAHDDE